MNECSNPLNAPQEKRRQARGDDVLTRIEDVTYSVLRKSLESEADEVQEPS